MLAAIMTFIMRRFFQFVLLGLVLLAVALASAVVTMSLVTHAQVAAVPDFVGKTPAEARRMAASNHLQLKIESQYYSSSVPEGRILSQLPAAGMEVRRDFEVRTAQSLGPQRVQIPSVVGQSERAAQMNIQQRGLDIGYVAQVFMPGIATEQVISQSPPANASDISAPRISLLVSEPAPAQSFVMPSFLGIAVGTATQTVQDAGLHIGTVNVVGHPPVSASTPNANDIRPGAGSIIVAQTPAAGEKVALGAAVSFQVK